MVLTLWVASVGLAATPHPSLPAGPFLPTGEESEPVRDPARAVLYQGRGIELVQAGKLEEAIAQFRRALAFDPLNAATRINLAYVLDRLGKYTEALAELDQAELLAPDDPTVHLNRGNTLLNLGKFQEALAPLIRVTELAPSNHQARVNLAVSYGKLGQTERANAELQAALEMLFRDALELGKQDKKPEAIAAYRQMIQLAPQFLPAYINSAILLEQAGELDQAILMIEAALKIAPQEVALLEMLQKLRAAREANQPPP